MTYAQDIDQALLYIISQANHEYSDDELECLQDLLLHPIALNIAAKEDIDKLIFLTDFEKQSVWAYVQANKPLQSIYELQMVLGLPLNKAIMLSHFCVVEPIPKHTSVDEMLAQGTHSFSLFTHMPHVNFNTYASYTSYQGTPIKTVMRYRYQSNGKVYWGITAKKDMGEQLAFRSTPGGFDYQSAYLQIKRGKCLESITFGDYHLQIGQGLSIWQGGFYGKSLEQASSLSLCNVQKHSSSNEFEFMRGGAAKIRLADITCTPFVSHKKIDGKPKEDSAVFPLQIYNTGMHRNSSEMRYKAAIPYTAVGLHSELALGPVKFGALYAYHSFSSIASLFTLHSKSIMFSYRKSGLKLFGELAFDTKNNPAMICGANMRIHSDVSIITMIRNYHPEYQSFMSKAFAEQSKVQNERGVYMQVVTKPFQFVTCSFSHDKFYMPNARYYVKTSTRGNELTAKIQYQAYSKFLAYYVYSFESKTEQLPNEQVYAVTQRQKSFHKCYVAMPIHPKLLSKTACMLQYVTKQSSSEGLLLYQDFLYDVHSSLKLSFRYAQFFAPYESRLYAWEDNVMYAWSSTQYFYEGKQIYVLCKWKPSKRIQLQAKISQTIYSNRFELPQSYMIYKNERKTMYSVFIQIRL